MTELKLTELLNIAYQWGRDYGANRSDKNFNDLLQTEAISQALRTPDVSWRSEQFCSCSFVMIMRDINTDVPYCSECGKRVNEQN